MKLFNPETWPENPTDADRRELSDMYAAHQKFKLKVVLLLGLFLLVRHVLTG